ncbi:AGE family epimerase/isomerase [Thetidibacter halocola]|uniref:AGE family epimerase/isomerase n=1 Tax=Thetidibacter halocola TaxID=2827239 RepID=A0A8J7WI55_9RHOB|nr:AGE family epimerase/isomerase [Thetidibacter halocola]MBS0125469.1 AGE family epimerase/isomerase [Thetidibacter halocola]
MTIDTIGPDHPATRWLADGTHRAFLRVEARRQFAFFRRALRPGGGFYNLDRDGMPLPDDTQALHSTTRMVHSHALAHLAGVQGSAAMIEQGMRLLWQGHRDAVYGGYLWAVAPDGKPRDDRKLAYGHVFVLLAAASARIAGHDGADRLLADAEAVLDRHFWETDAARFRDEWRRNWSPLSEYRGMNANMHGVEALLAAFEATGREVFLIRAGGILDFFLDRMARDHAWRVPEHYHADWSIDSTYDGDKMFRPAGTTPGHSVEWARLALQHWDLAGRPDTGAPDMARALVDRALADAWLPEGGLAYTLEAGTGRIAIADRYWWPMTELIGALAAVLKTAPRDSDETWYRRAWRFAAMHFIDMDQGGWFPEIDSDGRPTETQFRGKPDIYHSVQAALLPLAPGLSRQAESLRGILA